MTALLIKRLVWGDGEQKDVLEVVVDEDVTTGNDTEGEDTSKYDAETEEEDDEEVNENDEEDSENNEKEDQDEDEDESESESNEDDTRDCNYSTFQIDFNREFQMIFTSPEFKTLYNLYAGLVLLSISAATYNWFATNDSYVDIVSTPEIYFFDEPFAITTHSGNSASAIANLPYIPALFLGISYASPEMCDTLNPLRSEYANDNRLFLWIQFALQLFTSVIADSRVLFSQEISAGLSFILLYNFFNLTTPEQSKQLIDAKTASMIIAMSVAGFLSAGLMPIIFIGFALALSMEFVVPNAFGLLTPDARLALLYPFGACIVTLLIDTLGRTSIIGSLHVAFDILFWQVLASSVDVVILSPRPGRFITNN
jgi:hypothetical protein